MVMVALIRSPGTDQELRSLWARSRAWSEVLTRIEVSVQETPVYATEAIQRMQAMEVEEKQRQDEYLEKLMRDRSRSSSASM